MIENEDVIGLTMNSKNLNLKAEIALGERNFKEISITGQTFNSSTGNLIYSAEAEFEDKTIEFNFEVKYTYSGQSLWFDLKNDFDEYLKFKLTSFNLDISELYVDFISTAQELNKELFAELER